MAEEKKNTTDNENTPDTPERPRTLQEMNEAPTEKAREKVIEKIRKGKPLDASDILLAQGLVEIFDPTVDNGYEIDKKTGKPLMDKPLAPGAFKQVPIVQAQQMLQSRKNLENKLKAVGLEKEENA